jgi:hypothetical protein
MSGSVVYPVTYGKPIQTNPAPAYVYGEYADDDNIQTFFANLLTQEYISFFYDVCLPIYTNTLIVGSLLDWVINGIYGLPRPLIQVGVNEVYGPIDTYPIDTLAIDSQRVVSQASYNFMTDDVYRRLLTWHFYKGDGHQFSIKWLKRRIARFIYTTNTVGTGIDDTSMVSVVLNANNEVAVTISSNNPLALTLQTLMLNGLVELPFQYSFTVVVEAVSGSIIAFTSDGGVLLVNPIVGYPTTPLGLSPGQLWSNSGVVNVVPGVTPNPTAPPVYFSGISAAGFFALGGGNLPLTGPTAGTGQLWNNGGEVNIA